VDRGQFHRGALDRRVSPVETSSAVYTPTSDHHHDLADRRLSGVLFFLTLHNQRQIFQRSTGLRHPRRVQRTTTGIVVITCITSLRPGVVFGRTCL